MGQRLESNPRTKVAPADRPVPTPLGSGLAALGAAGLWGGMYVVSKDTFSEIPPLTLAALRITLGGIVLSAVLAARGRLRWPGDRRLLLAGALLAGTLVAQFLGTHLATASEGALLTTTTPLFIVPLAWAFLGERPAVLTVIGILAGGAGVALAVSGGLSFSRSPWGPILLLVSAAGWAGYTIASARPARERGPLIAVTWATLVAIPMVALVALTEVGRWDAAAYRDPATLAAIAYLGIAASAGAWYLWNRGVAGLPAAVAGAFFFVQPIVGGLLARALLGERLGWPFVAGGLLIMVGVLLALRSADRAGASRPPHPDPSVVRSAQEVP
jgi:drug/metabolite transporter (DMT)-like permease